MAREETQQERADRVLADLDRRFITWRGHTIVRNDWLIAFLGGLPVGAVLAVVLALTGRGGPVVLAVLLLGLLVLPALFVLLFLLSLAARGRGRRASFRALHLWGGLLGVLVALRIASVLDRGLRDVLGGGGAP